MITVCKLVTRLSASLNASESGLTAGGGTTAQLFESEGGGGADREDSHFVGGVLRDG